MKPRFGTRAYVKTLRKLAKMPPVESIVAKPTNVGYQGKRNQWIGYNEFEENHTNDKRDYYRKEYLKSDHWRALKKRKLSVNNNCERCQSKKSLDVHHLDYKNLYDVELTDLETLCRKCHLKEHPPESLYEKLCRHERRKIENDNESWIPNLNPKGWITFKQFKTIDFVFNTA